MRIAILAAVIASTSAHAQQRDADEQRGELALSNDTLQLRYLGKEGGVGDGGQLTGAFFLSEERDFVLSAGVLFPVDLDFGRLEASFGPQVYAALLEDENNDVMAVSVGAELRFFLNPRRGLAFSGQAYYAPDS